MSSRWNFGLTLSGLFLLITALSGISGCGVFSCCSGGGNTKFTGLRAINPANVALPPGYRIEAVASGFTFPTGVTFDERGRIYVVESGYSYGEVWTTPQLLRIEPDGRKTVIARGGKNGPWNGVAFSDGFFYVAEGGEMEGGRILSITPSGEITPLIENLPSRGDHHTDGPTIGPDGWVYFGQGTATNSGVVGPDNAKFGWLKRYPEFHDIPGQDIVLTGENFTSDDVLGNRGKVTTGAFSAYGNPTQKGQIIPGQVPCSGSIMRIRKDGGDPELIAWGFRNPFALGFSPDGRLFAINNGYDNRGSRPVFASGDALWEVKTGVWYGWPDFDEDRPLDDPYYDQPGFTRPKLLLAEHPNIPPKPVAVFPVHSSSDGIDFSRNPAFGYAGEAFVAQFGDETPVSGTLRAPVGFKVVRVNLETGVMEDFAVNRGKTNGPASKIGNGGLERPISLRFDPEGTILYVVDFGVLTVSEDGVAPQRATGVLWRISRNSGRR